MEEHNTFHSIYTIINSNRRLRLLLFIFLFFSIALSAIGHAALNSELHISGEATVRASADIRITNVSIIDRSSGAYDTYSPKYSIDSTTLFATLPGGGYMVYEVTISNNSNDKYEISSVIENLFTAEEGVSYIIQDVNGNPFNLSGIRLKAGQARSFRIKFTNTSSTEQIANLDLSYDFGFAKLCTAMAVGETEEFTTVGQNEYSVICDGRYQLEVWGAGSGSIGIHGRVSGGYSKGEISLDGGQTIYVVNGGAGTDLTEGMAAIAAGGYNGGGNSQTYLKEFRVGATGGGGATHIAYIAGTLAEIGEDRKDQVIIVAGGAGGCLSVYDYNTRKNGDHWGGQGGGVTGNNGRVNTTMQSLHQFWLGQTGSATGPGRVSNVAGVIHENDGAFGKGGDAIDHQENEYGSGVAGGGGGWYGGSGGFWAGGGGGSGYIGGVENGVTTTQSTYKGNGKAVITYLGE